ncbi:hypothetical protein G5V57_01125 [Nordella sp. HKS 07]|uniref:hypothetical protein n=1 Tax=Nordella sp. HKS 07 TaxID=2712222 RepID=UPI0013E1AC7B|nr:hypothetical protein [Nordella sp. HKS 07]QIG46479.1 hypothetical protein G5V57_01125 [Nordella sp. HKS 07]
MGEGRTISLSSLRHGTFFAFLAFCLLTLAACSGGGSQPFAKSGGTPGPSGKTVPPIALAEVTGLPATKLPQLRDALAISAGKRDMAILDSRLDASTLSLRGNFHIIPDTSAVRLGYNWTLTDPNGTVLHTISAEEVAPGLPGVDPWAQVTPAVLQRVAAYTAESLSSRLSQLGYATEVGGLPPPIETYARAGPNADKEIDYETLNGPMQPPAAPTVAVAGAAPAPVPGTAEPAPLSDKQLSLADAADNEPADEKAASATAKPAKSDAADRKEIAAVAVIPVKGAPGKGNAELTQAMRETLQDAGWPVLSKPRHDALIIAGLVKLGPVEGKTQKVDLAWEVKSPDGKTLGTVRQANSVPSGSLAAGFGNNAVFAAQAAARGISDLVTQYR